MRRRESTDEQWERLKSLLPPQKPRTGRPSRDHRTIVDGILWVLRTGAPWRDLPERYGPWQTVASRYIRDWNLCDWFCVKVLGPLVEQQGEACARAISEWREVNSVWQCRASVVAFVNLASKGDRNFPGFTEMVLNSCSHLLGSQERFVQTGVGWVLRELSRSDQGRVVGFVEANLDRFSREGLKNATKHLPPEVAEHLLQEHLPSGTRGRRRR